MKITNIHLANRTAYSYKLYYLLYYIAERCLGLIGDTLTDLRVRRKRFVVYRIYKVEILAR